MLLEPCHHIFTGTLKVKPLVRNTTRLGIILAILLPIAANAFDYYTDGSAAFLKKTTSQNGKVRYTGCGPTQCLSIGDSSRTRALEMIGGPNANSGDPVWEYRGSWGSCDIWVRPKPQGTYPSLERVLSKLQEEC